MERVLILMSTYNGETYLKPQLDSILKQTHPCDLLVRDDGSQDQTLMILKEYAQKHSNITVIEGKNVGVTNSFFALLKQAKGYDFYAFSDQDDVWMQDKIELALRSLRKLDQARPALYASCSLLVDDSLQGTKTTQKNLRGLTFENVIIQNIMPGHAQVFNQKLVDFINAHPVDTKKVAVHDYWLSMCGVAFGQVVFDNDYHTYYRQHGNNEIGYGQGLSGWFVERLRRIKKKKAQDITRQNKLFYDTFQKELQDKQLKALRAMIFSQHTFGKRMQYLRHTKVYRQKKFETFLFYVLYALGGYRIDEMK